MFGSHGRRAYARPSRISLMNVIWDMGGTLIDTYPEVDRTLAGAVWGEGVTAARLHEVAELRQESIAHAIGVLSERHRVSPDALQRAYDELKQRWSEHPAPLMDGAREVLAAVHGSGGLNLVATHRDRTSAEALVTALGIEIDDLVCAPDGLPRKPDPAMNLLLMDRHGLDPDAVLCVGDRPIDVLAAQASGTRGVLLDPGATTPPDALPEGCLVIADLRELIGLARIR
ncbi:Phosphoglycolate phosphatase [Acidipropionibacterium virtanenii]|uniref:Phosphoglycolate phosphatase n=2 Tax=Acidipropionibacterium virtanenii TaxID=2057246 RepID=A0A344UVR8_9ACTN|nr:Phosphoglycolate phosphatase [Acidipropionibacterium virtanenii]